MEGIDTMQLLNRIKSVRNLGDFRVQLVFSDGYIAELDLSPALAGPVFEPLKDPNYFGQVRIEDHTIRWPNGADLGPDVLRFWCEAGGVRSQQETDAHF